jgi:hypothetical protein
MKIFLFPHWIQIEAKREVSAMGPPESNPPSGPGCPGNQVGFIETVKIQNQIVLFGTEPSYQAEDFPESGQLAPVSPLQAIDGNHLIDSRAHVQDGSASMAYQDRDLSLGEPLSEGAQGREQQDDIPQASQTQAEDLPGGNSW